MLALDIRRAIDVSRFGTLEKLLLTTCYVIRFVRREFQHGDVSSDEMAMASREWCKSVQRQAFCSNEVKIHKTIASLRLFEDEYGVLCCRTRIEASKMDYSATNPIFIPATSYSRFYLYGTPTARFIARRRMQL